MVRIQPVLDILGKIDQKFQLFPREVMCEFVLDIIPLIESEARNVSDVPTQKRFMCAVLGHVLNLLGKNICSCFDGSNSLSVAMRRFECEPMQVVAAMYAGDNFRTKEDVIGLANLWQY